MQGTVIIGGGPGGMGPLIWAAQTGNLNGWLRQGVTVIDRQKMLGGTLGRYAINSDSLGAAYLECLEAPLAIDALRMLRDDPVTHEMEQYRQAFPPLNLVDRFMRRIGASLDALIRSHPDCSIRSGTSARALHVQRDGSIRVELDNGDNLAARTAVMALGGKQNWSHQLWENLRPGLSLSDCRLRHLMSSDRLLTPQGLDEITQVLAGAAGRQIVILGGSHSAYSAAWAITRLIDSNRLGAGQIMILARRLPPVFYANAEAAMADGYEVQPGDVCPRTGRVHRLGGLRGNGRDIWRQISGRPATQPETRVRAAMLGDFDVEALRALLEDAAVVIPAFGYSAATLPVFTHRKRRVALHAEAGQSSVDDAGRILRADGQPLPNLFGIGLGSGYRPSGSMGGEANFSGQANSLWLYQNDIGALLYHGIQRCLRQPLGKAKDSVTEPTGRYPACTRPALP